MQKMFFNNQIFHKIFNKNVWSEGLICHSEFTCRAQPLRAELVVLIWCRPWQARCLWPQSARWQQTCPSSCWRASTQHHGRAKPSSSMPRVLGVLIQARGLKCPMYGEVNFVLIVLLAARRKNSLSKMFCGLEHYP